MSAHVMTWTGKTVTFCGPFNSAEDAAFFGRAWQAVNRDSPCWQVLDDGADSHLSLSVLSLAQGYNLITRGAV